MKLVKIFKNSTLSFFSKFDQDDKMQEWINECVSKNSWGLPERPELMLDEATGEMIPTGNTLPAEYEIVIENLEENPQWLLEQAIQKRRLEYPSAEEFLNAFFDGGDEALEQLKNKRLEIKAKYPKP